MNNSFMDGKEIKIAIPIVSQSPSIHPPTDKTIIFWLNYLNKIDMPWRLLEVADASELFDYTDMGTKFYVVSILPPDINKIQFYINHIRCCYELPDALIIEDHANRNDDNIHGLQCI